MNLEARGSYKYAFKWECNVSNTNFLYIKEKLTAGFSPTKQFFLWTWTTPYNSCFKCSILSLGICIFDILGWGYNVRKEFQVSVCSRSKPSSKLYWSRSLQQSPKQESMHLLSTCQIPFRYVHQSSNGICFKVRSSSNWFLASAFKCLMAICFHGPLHILAMFCILMHVSDVESPVWIL